MRRLLEMVAALVLKRVLGRPRQPVTATAPARSRRPRSPRRGGRQAARRPAAAPRPARPRATPQGRPRGPLVGAMLGSFAIGVPVMLVFDTWYTRTVGVVALFTFVICGVLAITGSGLLDPEEEE